MRPKCAKEYQVEIKIHSSKGLILFPQSDAELEGLVLLSSFQSLWAVSLRKKKSGDEMATVTERLRKNGKKTFRVEVHIKGNPTLSKSFEKRSDALDWAKQQEVQIKQGYLINPEADRQTISEIIDFYLEDVVSKMRRSSNSNYTKQLEWFDKRIGDLSLRKLTPTLII